jgi:hypothetical protein
LKLASPQSVALIVISQNLSKPLLADERAVHAVVLHLPMTAIFQLETSGFAKWQNIFNIATA